MKQETFKVYVQVNADFREDGRIIPRYLVWEDGTRFEIDKVTDVRPAASLKAGGCGMRYTCLIQGGEHYLFYEGNARWFVEARQGREIQPMTA